MTIRCATSKCQRACHQFSSKCLGLLRVLEPSRRLPVGLLSKWADRLGVHHRGRCRLAFVDESKVCSSDPRCRWALKPYVHPLYQKEALGSASPAPHLKTGHKKRAQRANRRFNSSHLEPKLQRGVTSILGDKNAKDKQSQQETAWLRAFLLKAASASY